MKKSRLPKTLQGVSSTDAFSSESRVPLAGEFVGVGGIGKSRTLKFFFFKGKGEDGINSGNDDDDNNDDNNDSNDNSNDNNNSSSNNHIHQEPKDASLGSESDPNLLGNLNPWTLVHAFEALQKKRSIKQIHCKPQGSSNAFESGQFGRDKRQLKLVADEPDCENKLARIHSFRDFHRT